MSWSCESGVRIHKNRRSEENPDKICCVEFRECHVVPEDCSGGGCVYYNNVYSAMKNRAKACGLMLA